MYVYKSSLLVIIVTLYRLSLKLAFSYYRSVNAVIIFSTGAPFPPVIENKEKKISFPNSSLIWSSPDTNGCPVTMYTVYYRAMKSSQAEENAWYRINVSAGTNDLSALPLECDTEYEIKVSAWNELIESNRSESWQVKSITGIYIIFYLSIFFFPERVSNVCHRSRN